MGKFKIKSIITILNSIRLLRPLDRTILKKVIIKLNYTSKRKRIFQIQSLNNHIYQIISLLKTKIIKIMNKIILLSSIKTMISLKIDKEFSIINIVQ